MGNVVYQWLVGHLGDISEHDLEVDMIMQIHEDVPQNGIRGKSLGLATDRNPINATRRTSNKGVA